MAETRVENEGPSGIPLSHRNTLPWWTIFLLFPLGLLPIILLLVVLVPDSLLRADLHLLLTLVVTIFVIVAGFGVLFIGAFYCNTLSSADNPMCNDAEYCGVYGPQAPGYCPQPALAWSPPRVNQTQFGFAHFLANVSPQIRENLDVAPEWTMHGWMSLGEFVLV